MKKILLFGGTTEGKEIATFLDQQDIPYIYSTKTKVIFEGKGRAIHGIMGTTQASLFCKQEKITHIINASHPFATVLHHTLATMPITIELIRFEREMLEHTVHPLVQYTKDFDTALEYLKNKKHTSLLALSGVQTIKKLKPFWEEHQAWFRILDRDSSRQIAKEAGFPQSQLLYGYPQSMIAEVDLIEKINPSILITKESGVNGKLEQKITAAIATKTPILIVKKPIIPNRYITLITKEELIKRI